MADRINTIEYGWESETNTIIPGELSQSISKTVYIPESNIQFNSVAVMLGMRHSILATTNATNFSVQIDNNPTQSFAVGPMLSNTTEHHVMHLYFDVSDYFKTYFTASNHDVSFYSSNTANTITGRTWKLICTYQFEDSASTDSIKTVRFPINSISAATLTTSEIYLGNYTASIPALDSYLPEIGKRYRDIFVEYHANDASSTTQNYNLRTKIDDGSQIARYIVTQSLQSSAYYHDIQNLSGSIDTSTTHSIRVSSTLTSRFTSMCGVLTVTYEYDYTGSTSIMNSLLLTGHQTTILNTLSSTLFSNYNLHSSYKNTIYIPETSSIQLRRSGIYVSKDGAAASNILIGTTTASYVTYTTNAGTIQSGFIPTIHQIDGTGSADSPISLNSGWNDINIYLQTIVGSTDIVLGGLLYLNYVSSPEGTPLQHNHSIFQLMTGSISVDSAVSLHSIFSGSVALPNQYYINDVTCVHEVFSGLISNIPLYKAMESSVYKNNSENTINSPYKIFSCAFQSDSRATYMYLFNGMPEIFNRYPNDLSNLMDIESNRYYAYRKITSTVTAGDILSMYQYITYNSNIFTITGSIQNYSGDGSGIEIVGFDYESGVRLFNTQSLVAGQIRMSWHNRHDDVILIAVTGSDRYASNVLPAGSGSYIITIPGAGSAPSSTEKSFTFIS